MDTLLTSPFSKRKNKEHTSIPAITTTVAPVSNSTTGIPVKQTQLQYGTSIPMPKKTIHTSFQSFLPTTLLTQQQQQQQQNFNSNNSISSSIGSSNSNIAISVNSKKYQNNQISDQNCSEFLQTQFVSSESSSGISSGSNKTASNSSRSTSPTNSLESAIAATSLTTLPTNVEMSKQLVKSSQQINSSSNSSSSKEAAAKQQKKSGLPKGISTKLPTVTSPSHVLYNTPTNPPVLNINNAISAQQTQNDKNSNSNLKLQSASNSNVSLNSNSGSESKSIKKFGASIKSGNLFGLNSKSNNNSQTNMPTLTQSNANKESSNSLSSTSSSSIKSSNNTIKKTSSNNLSSASTSSSCSIPKLTKLNYDSSKNLNNSNETNALSDSSSSTVNTNSSSNLRKLQYSTQTSKIPNCSIAKKSDTNIKAPSTSTTTTASTSVHSVKPPTQIQTHSTNSTDNDALQTPSKQTISKQKLPASTDTVKSVNSNLPALNPNLTYSKLPNKLKTSNQSNTSTNSVTNNNTSTPIKKPTTVSNETLMIVENNTPSTKITKTDKLSNISNNIARVTPFKVDSDESPITSPVTPIVPIISQPVLTSTPSAPTTKSSTNDNNDLPNEDYLKISEYNDEIKLLNDLKLTNATDINANLNHNGYPSDKDLSTYARKIQKRFKEGMQAVKESMQFALSDEDNSDAQFDENFNHLVESNGLYQENMFDKKLINGTTNGDRSQINHNNLKSSSSSKLNELLNQNITTGNTNNNNNSQMIQNLMQQQYLKTQNFNQLPNTFGKSNTLDRKIKQSYMQVNGTNATTAMNASLSFKSFTSSLERTKHLQKQQLMMYQQQQQQQQQQSSQQINNDSNKVTFYSNRLSLNSTETINSKKTSVNSKRPLSEDTILENPNTIQFLSSSNDNLVNLNVNQNSGIHPKISYNEELLNKEKEIINLKLELENARNRILTMTNQLNTNAHIVTTLEQNLASLTLKVQTLSVHVQRKDKTINELKGYLEILSNKYPKIFENEKLLPLVRHNSTESMSSLNSLYSQRSFQSTSEVESSSTSNGKKKRSWLRSSFIKAFNRHKTNNKKLSPDIVDYNISDTASTKRYSDIDENCKLIITQNSANVCLNGPYSLPNSPIHQQIALNNSTNCLMQSNSRLSNMINDDEFEEIQKQLREKESKLTDIQLEALASAHQLDQLKEEFTKMKREMDALRDENYRLKTISSLNNSDSLDSPNRSLNSDINSSINEPKKNQNFDTLIHDLKNLESLSEKNSDKLIKRIEECKNLNHEIITQSFKDSDGKRVLISIYHGNSKHFDDLLEDKEKLINIGSLNINTRTKWDILDNVVKRLFKEYLNRLDSKTTNSQQQSLGLTLDSLDYYYVGDMIRTKDATQNPDLLPYGYLVGNYTNIIICLKDVNDNCLDRLCYETLVPKNILQRYISLLNEYKHLLLCGQTGTGKSFIAKTISEYLVKLSNQENNTIEYFNVENKSSKDLKQYLNNLIEQTNLPYVLILDNLHNIANISDAFNDFFNTKSSKKLESFIIGTVNHPNITSLNIHENFKWILCVNHAEPVNNYLSRYLERSLIEHEINVSNKCIELQNIINWIPKFWLHINKCIETYNSADVTLGPKLFSTIPLDKDASKYWFIELWNHSLVPYIIETILEGVQVYGSELKWEDPKFWIIENSPWILNDIEKNSLRSIKANDVGCEIDVMAIRVSENKSKEQIDNNGKNSLNEFEMDDEDIIDKILSPIASTSKSNNGCLTNSKLNDGDNLINMLMRLQEVTLSNQKRAASTRLCDTNLSLNSNMIITLPKSVESAL